MAERRAQIDAIDIELCALLVIRTGYVDRAVDLKKIENLPAQTTDWVAEVLNKASATAIWPELDPALVRTFGADSLSG